MEERNMCRKLVAVNKLGLGNRELGWEVFSLPRGEVLEFTTKQLRDIIKGGKDEVYGLKIGENSTDLVFDESFYTRNLMYKVHINSLVPLVEDECMVNLFYIVIGTHEENGVTMYDVISSRYARDSFTAEKVKTLLDLHIISAGAKLNEKGEILVAPLEKVKPLENEKSAEPEKPVKTENPLEKKEPEKPLKTTEKKK